MIKKIICPTDLSEVATNATGFAAKLAQVNGAELILIHVYQSEPLLAVPGTAEIEASLISDRLRGQCEEISRFFKISADYEVDIGSARLSTLITSAKQENTLVVMGTNGSDTLYQRFFGATTYQVIKNSMCPVLVVPQQVSYRSISNIVYAWNYQEGEKFSFPDLFNLTRSFEPHYTFLHVSTHNVSSTIEVFTALRHEAESFLGGETNVEFVQLFAESVAQGIESFMHKSEADLLAISHFSRKALNDFFKDQLIKKLIGNVEYPILVLHA